MSITHLRYLLAPVRCTPLTPEQKAARIAELTDAAVAAAARARKERASF